MLLNLVSMLIPVTWSLNLRAWKRVAVALTLALLVQLGDKLHFKRWGMSAPNHKTNRR